MAVPSFRIMITEREEEAGVISGRIVWHFLIMNPDGVRQMLLDNFAGVRIDGSNATIIGSKQGEFVADRIISQECGWIMVYGQ